MYENALKSYQQTNVNTANPARLVLMCFDGAVRSLKLARDSYLAREYEAKGRALQKTLDIIHELNASLDMQKGGDVAVNLRGLYTYLTQMLTEADLKKDLDLFDKGIHLLQELESAWKEIAAQGAVDARSVSSCAVPAAGPKGIAVGQAWSA
jgi:flagellar protein FliS